MTDTLDETRTRKLLANARKLLVRNITSGPRPDEEELLLMSEPYKMVWEEEYAKQKREEGGDQDLLDCLDPPNV